MRLVRLIGLLLLILVVLLVLFYYFRPRPQRDVRIALASMLDEAEMRTTVPSLHEAVKRETVTINGTKRNGIYAHPWTRIAFPITVPRDGQFSTAIALLPEAWTMGGDGVTFRMGVSTGAEYKDLLKIYLDPKHDERDRQWQPVTVDLSRWAGRQVKLILNTDAGPKADPVADWAFWGDPVVTGREYVK